MSNPWRTTPADVGLTSLFRLLHAFDNDHENSMIQQTRMRKPGLIDELKDLDAYIIAKREADFQKTAYELRPELKRSSELVDHISELFNQISIELDTFNQSDALKKSYANALKTSQIIWDDISQENKAKLVSSIRLAIDAILRIFHDKDQSDAIISHQLIIQELIERTNVFDETKEFDDYYLEDLYDLLTECCNALELITRTSPSRRKS